jgi:hypothetical protein
MLYPPFYGGLSRVTIFLYENSAQCKTLCERKNFLSVNQNDISPTRGIIQPRTNSRVGWRIACASDKRMVWECLKKIEEP